MKIEYDAAHDLLNIEFLADVPIDDSLEVDGIVIDYAKDSVSLPSRCWTRACGQLASLWILSIWPSLNLQGQTLYEDSRQSEGTLPTSQAR